MAALRFAVMETTYNDVITITFGDQGENHVGMQKIGKRVEPGQGFSLFDLQRACLWCKANGVKYELWDLRSGWSAYEDEDGVEIDIENKGPPSYLFIARGLVDVLLDSPLSPPPGAGRLYDELISLEYDKQFLHYGSVKNRNSHHNLCFWDRSQAPDYAKGMGTVVAFDDVPVLSELKDRLPDVFGPKAVDLIAEGNHYFDLKKCYIGWHGDTERRKVIGVRLGGRMVLKYRWYFGGVAISDAMSFSLNGGDVYAMSEHAVGTHWKTKSIYSLRHAAGDYKTD